MRIFKSPSAFINDLYDDLHFRESYATASAREESFRMRASRGPQGVSNWSVSGLEVQPSVLRTKLHGGFCNENDLQIAAYSMFVNGCTS